MRGGPPKGHTWWGRVLQRATGVGEGPPKGHAPGSLKGRRGRRSGLVLHAEAAAGAGGAGGSGGGQEGSGGAEGRETPGVVHQDVVQTAFGPPQAQGETQPRGQVVGQREVQEALGSGGTPWGERGTPGGLFAAPLDRWSSRRAQGEPVQLRLQLQLLAGRGGGDTGQERSVTRGPKYNPPTRSQN